MQSGLMILMESTLSFGLPLAFAVHELRSLNRRPPPSDWTPPPVPPVALPPSSTAPLPAPRLPVAPARPRVRVLEDA
jgi:hypothetical protein